MRDLLLFFVLLCSTQLWAQDTIYIDEQENWLNHSIADHFTIYESKELIDYAEFKDQNVRQKLTKTELDQSVDNLDFTTSYFYIHGVIVNNTHKAQWIYLETARPITNTAKLSVIYYDKVFPEDNLISGDAIPFNQKVIASNKTVFPIYVLPGDHTAFFMTLGSDGEIISLPMIFWEAHQFAKNERQQQFYHGIFYGIFLFVIVIYLTFYALIRDRLYLTYSVYVFFSGMLQFSLDGYAHQFLFPSGGYMTQHIVILVAGGTVFFAYTYATSYLELTGRTKKIARALAIIVLLTTVASLIPGKLYELCYPLINGFSFLSLLFLFIVGIRIRRTNKSVSPLFLLGIMTLIFGAAIFILGNFSVIDVPALTQNSLKIATLIEIICLSVLMAGKYKQLQDEKDAAQRRLLVELEEKNRLAKETNVRLEKEVQERTEEIEKQRALLKEQNQDLMSSIKYAERIQKALLPSERHMKEWLHESFVFFRPKDILSGDFYWMEEVVTTNDTPQKMLLFATADCTGHGVPGAIVSIVCNNLLKLSKIQRDVNTTGEALDFINHEISTLLNSKYNEEQIKDGMDVSLCALNFDTHMLYYSGAKIPLYLIRNGELTVYKGDRRSIGYSSDTSGFTYTTNAIQLQPGDMLYSFSDGIPDQFGGEEGKKFLTKRLKEMLLRVSLLPIDDQRKEIEATINAWMGTQTQIDDMLLVGVRIA